MTLRTVLGTMAVALGVLTTSAFAASSANVSSEAAVTGAAEAVTRADAETDSSPGKVDKKGSDVAVIESECLKEAEPCNIITNRCCPGYSCQGGLAAVCVRVR